jgi:hypothetical protein
MSKPFDKNRIDVAQAFLIFMACVGDCDRTAAALDLEPSQVKELAESEGWTEKIRRVSMMSKGGKPGDWERSQNRAMAFCQAHLIRQQIDRLLRVTSQLDDEELMNRCAVTTKSGGKQLSAKFFCDLTQAAEACHRMAYAALGDTVTERVDQSSGTPEGKASDLHSAIIAALSNPAVAPPSSSLLLAETNDKLEQFAELPERKSSAPSETGDDR